MSLFQQFDDLRNTVNQLMGDFDMGIRSGGGGGGGGGRRRGSRQRGGRRGDDMDTDVSSCSNSACPCGDSCECGDLCSCGTSTTKQQQTSQPQQQSKPQPQRRQPRRQSGLDLFGFPSFGFGGGFFDEDILDLPLLVGVGGSDIGGGGATSGKAGAGKEDEEKKMVDVGGAAATGGGEQQVAAPQQGSQQVGTAQPTFKPDAIMRARVNIEDQPDKLIVTADLPGFSKENIKVNVSDDGLLTIKGEQTQEWKDQSKDKKYLRAERSFANVQRTIRVPKGVDVSKIGASYENGVLHVNLPKLPEAEKRQSEIAIQ